MSHAEPTPSTLRSPDGNVDDDPRHEAGGMALEWALLLAAIALPFFYIIMMGLNLLVAHYRMITTMNALPLP